MPRLPSLLATSDRRSLPGGDVMAWCRELGAAGVDGLWLREKDLEDGALHRLAVAVRAVFAPPLLLMVSARPDVALAAGADGVHLPAAGLPTAPLRRRWGGRLIVGRSTHSLAEVEGAAAAGADYVTFGPVYTTPTKTGFGPPRGLEELSRAARVGIPVFALGGVTRKRLGEVAGAGASGAAGIRLFQDRATLPLLVEEAHGLFSRRGETRPV